MRKEILIVLAALAAVSLANLEDLAWCKKTITEGGKDYTFDLNPLRDPDGITLRGCKDPDDPNTYDYTINICGFVRHGCNDTYVETVSQKEEFHTGDLACKICAVTSATDKIMTINPEKPDIGVSLNVYGGTPYSHDPCSGISRSVRFNIFCDCNVPSETALQNTLFIEEQQNNCGPYIFQVDAVAGCPIGYCDKPSGGGGHNDDDDDGISGGWIFIIILLCLSVIYFGGGMAYKIFAKGARGIEACPNIGFWRSFCGMTKDGFTFVFSGCKTNKSYSTFDDAGVADAGETPAASTKTYGSL
eukprot:TRINITY_DN499_c0_g1_i1.p1 TRINITY_DN499_c0_g1~~TRINITY_DN499_c0_g1_i1.p1  ORF type:complete len:355 (-),score=85.22 TRINITY_DN499_c0_g1_i1:519-1424(-)